MTRPAGWLLVLALVLIPAGAVCAQTKPNPPAGEPAKNPPPPLFPKHRRGLYTNNRNIEVIDATPQSPPLETDDPGVPDKGEYEINLLTEADLAADERHMNMLTVDANYGIVLRGWGHELPTQLKFEAPIAAYRENGNPYEIGLGDSLFGLKFNFYNDENRGLRLSVYPQVEFSTKRSAEKGLAETGQTLVLPFLFSCESKYMTMVGNAGVEKAVNDEGRATMIDLGFGAGRAFFRKLAIMGEIRTSSATDFKSVRLVSASGGILYGVGKTIWYARVGHSLFSDDGRHMLVGLGLKVLIDTEHREKPKL